MDVDQSTEHYLKRKDMNLHFSAALLPESGSLQ